MNMPMSRKTVWISGGVLLLVLLGIAAVLFFQNRHPSEISKEKAEKQVLDQYGGKIVSRYESGNGYVFKLKTEKGLYELTVAGDGSGIRSVQSLERYETAPPAAGETGKPAEPKPGTGPGKNPPSSENAGNTPIVLISEQEAKKIALGKVQGTVKDVDLDRKKGVWYYFIEIDTADEKEAVVQLGAASGKVQSVSWDDDDD